MTARNRNAREALYAAYRDPYPLLQAQRDRGRPVVGWLGLGPAEEVLLAAGCLPVRLRGDPTARTDAARFMEPVFGGSLRSIVSRLCADGLPLDWLVVDNSGDPYSKTYHYLLTAREMGMARVPDCYILNFAHLPYRVHAEHNRRVLGQFVKDVEQRLGSAITPEALSQAVARCRTSRDLLRQLDGLRKSHPPQLSGSDLLVLIGTSLAMDKDEHSRLARAFLEEARATPPEAGRCRLFVCGSEHDHVLYYQLFESCGAVVVGEDHSWGQEWLAAEPDGQTNPLEALVERYQLGVPCPGKETIAGRVQRVLRRLDEARAEACIVTLFEHDAATLWDLPELVRAIEGHGVPVLVLQGIPYNPEPLRDVLAAEVHDFIAAARGGRRSVSVRRFAPDAPAIAESRPAPSQPQQRRDRVLAAARAAIAHQREWFRQLQEQVRQGMPYALVSAASPHEIFRAMDIPYLVSQWWASLSAAAQYSSRYLGLLEEAGYRDLPCAYCALSVACGLDTEPESGPWGGLPRPSLVVGSTLCDSQIKLLSLWWEKQRVPFYVFENTAPRAKVERWWERVATEWEEVFDQERLDLMAREMESLVQYLEVATGRTLSESRLREVIAKSNQQMEYYRKARDLIAATVPAPVSITDVIPAVMLSQWHRGTDRGIELARQLYEEIAALATQGVAVCEREQARIMWIGRALWFDMGFYTRLERTLGAVCVWSIYSAIAADGYARYGGDPLRALASRYTSLEDMLHLPTWNVDWYLEEARRHRVTAAIHVLSAECTLAVEGSHFIRERFEREGIPVLELAVDNVDSRGWDEATVTALIAQFLQRRLGIQPLAEE